MTALLVIIASIRWFGSFFMLLMEPTKADKPAGYKPDEPHRPANERLFEEGVINADPHDGDD
jgi:hypothetical protein